MNRRLYDYDEAAAELRVEKWWLQRRIKHLPHVKFGREVFFTPADLDEITAMHHRNPKQTVQPQPVATDNVAHFPKPLPARARRTS